MNSRRRNRFLSLMTLCMTLAIAGDSRAQYSTLANAGYPTYDLYGRGYGSTPFGGYDAFPYGYQPLNGEMGTGYQGAGALINDAAQAAAAQPPAAVTRPVFDVRTAAPGFYVPARRVRRRLNAQPKAAPAPAFDKDGKIAWPAAMPDEPALATLRQAADEAVRAVVHESNTKGHASIHPVIEAKNKLTALERKVLPEAKARNADQGTAIEAFFRQLDLALDVLTIPKEHSAAK